MTDRQSVGNTAHAERGETVEANEAMPKGYDPNRVTEPPVSSAELADKILLGMRLRAVARKALRVGTVACVATAVLTGVSLTSSQPASASVVTMEPPQADPYLPVVPTPTRLPSRFLLGTWFDMGAGNLWVAAPLQVQARVRGWVANRYTTVQVQERLGSVRRNRWVIRATLTTNHDGVAWGRLHVGGGIHYFRVVHRPDRVSGPAVGSTRRVVVTTEPFDIY